MGFYVHCVYASLFIETIRRDFAVLMIHHFLTLGLLGYSYSVRSVLNPACETAVNLVIQNYCSRSVATVEPIILGT